MHSPKKPNLFIVGAPKCGTTTIAEWLSVHPQVFMSKHKEPNFFNYDGRREFFSLSEYEELFSSAKSQHIVIGEATTNYLYSKVAIRNIAKYNPDAKIVVCLRNPVDMAYSLHCERVAGGDEAESDFEKAWRLQGRRAIGESVPYSMRRHPSYLLYGQICKLGEQLERVYNIFSMEKVFIIFLEDLQEYGIDILNSLCDFCGVQQSQLQVPRLNQSKKVRSTFLSQAIKLMAYASQKTGIKTHLHILGKMHRINTFHEPRAPLNPSFKAELLNYFYEDIWHLAELTQRDLSSWLEE